MPSQTPPSNPPTTPLKVKELERILHGTATVGDEGVVTVTVERTDEVKVDDVVVNPDAGISTTIEFKPVNMNSDAEADVVPDFSMTAEEINPVVTLMLTGKDQKGKDMNWYQGCLYNQETAETPQLYFDHMLKRGNPYELAAEIRLGLDLTKSEKSTQH